jgi:hypothetical protein
MESSLYYRNCDNDFHDETIGDDTNDVIRTETSFYHNGECITIPKQKYFIQRSCYTKYHYFCNQCDYRACLQSTMSMHVAIKHAKQDLYLCSECPSKFPVKSKLQQHINNHHRDAYLSCPYEYCKCRFKSKSTQIFHYVRKHMDLDRLFTKDKDTFYKKQMICRTCSERFYPASIYYHVGICSKLSPFAK